MYRSKGIDMNERIKELSIKAGFPEWSNHAIEFELEKLAELIIQECIDIISPYTVRMSRPGEEFLHPISEIKKRFGVE
jgi:hypothetical protein